MAYDALVFDADGVLVEPTARAPHDGAIRRALAEFGVEDPTQEVVEGLRSVTPESLRTTCEALGVDDVAGFWATRDGHASAVQRAAIASGEKALYDDLDAVLDLPVPRAIVTNNQQTTVDFLLEHHGLVDRFDPVLGRAPTLEDIARKKPAPYFVERAVEALGARRPLFVGDSDADLAAAAAAGVDSAFVRRDHRADYALEHEPTHELESLAALASLVVPGVPTASDD